LPKTRLARNFGLYSGHTELRCSKGSRSQHTLLEGSIMPRNIAAMNIT